MSVVGAAQIAPLNLRVIAGHDASGLGSWITASQIFILW